MENALKIMGLSGGIATGKSTCVEILTQLLPGCVVFDADACVRELYTHTDVRQALMQYFGKEIVLPDGEVDKAKLRKRIFSDATAKTALEDVFHPRVRKECLALLEITAKKNVSRLFVADVPLLFENGFDFGQSANLLVATSRQTQIERLKNRNGWSDNAVQTAISAQMPLENKMILADTVFWNEGPVKMLESQCARFLRTLGLS